MNNSDSVDDYDMGFNFIRFLKFLQNNNILGVAIAAVLSDRINELTTSFVSNLVIPLMERDGDNDGEKDIKKIEDKSIKAFGVEFGIGRFAVAIIKFVIVTYIIFIISVILRKYINKI